MGERAFPAPAPVSRSARPASISRTVSGRRMDFCWRPARTYVTHQLPPFQSVLERCRPLTRLTTFTLAAPEPSLGATASTTLKISLCIIRTNSMWFSRCAMSHRCSMKYIMFARLFMEFCLYDVNGTCELCELHMKSYRRRRRRRGGREEEGQRSGPTYSF